MLIGCCTTYGENDVYHVHHAKDQVRDLGLVVAVACEY